MSAIWQERGEPEGDQPSLQHTEARGSGAGQRPQLLVRRNPALAALVGSGASAMAIAYLWRATATGAGLDWALCGLMAVVGAFFLAELVDARTPLAVADELGVRVRLGSQWRGLPWEAVQAVEVVPGRGPLRDGRLLFLPAQPARALDGLEARARRHARANRFAYGTELAVPLGLTTRVSPGSVRALQTELGSLADGRAPVQLTGRPDRRDGKPPASGPARRESDAPRTRPRIRPGAAKVLLGEVSTVVSRRAKAARDPEKPLPSAEAPPTVAPAPDPAPVPLRATRKALRAQVTHGRPSDESQPGTRERHVEGRVDLVVDPVPDTDPAVSPIARLGDSVAPLVVDDFTTEPADDPVIGPELAAARTRVGLSVDELAERTRIRPHVIEAIEVDDFAPCGGDFYARGHLRTLARVLGQDVTPMLEFFDARYAEAPINASKVFEAELATGSTGGLRATAGGPRWGLLVGAVLVLMLVWGLVRLFASEPAETLRPAPVVMAGSTGLGKAFPDVPRLPAEHPRVHLVLTARKPAHVVVRDGSGKVVYAHDMTAGQTEPLHSRPPVRVTSTDGAAVTATVDGKHRGRLGPAGHPARRTFR